MPAIEATSMSMAGKDRLIFLDGLRGWGALAVVLYHIFVEIFPPSNAAAGLLFRLPLFDGVLAVMIFFVVSGISLSAAFVAVRDRNILVRMAVARYPRLTIPIAFACLIAFIFSRLGLTLDVVHRANTSDALHLLDYAFSKVYTHISPLKSPIPPLWTMPIELRGSALVLGVLFVVGNFRFRFIVYAALLAVTISITNFELYAAFIAGIIIAEMNVLYRTRGWKIMAPALLAIIAGVIYSGTSLGNFYVGYVVSAIAIVAGVMLFPPARHFFETKLSQWLASISFPLYLTHIIIVCSLGVWLHHQSMPHGKSMVVGADCMTFVSSIAFARAFRWIDSIGITFSRRVSRHLISATQRAVQATKQRLRLALN